MKKLIPDGCRIKFLRLNSERASTQKEVAYAVRVSERTLRKIENENMPIGVDLLDRFASRFGVHRTAIMKRLDTPLVTANPNPFDAILTEMSQDTLVPRHDTELAHATMDEGKLFHDASHVHDLVCHISIPLTDETAGYAEELFEILEAQTWDARDGRLDLLATEELAIRRRIKMLLVLLKGNEVWVYETTYYRRLPERFDPAPEGEPLELRSRLVVALGPPGEYGEDSIRVQVDYGQPVHVRGLMFDVKKSEGASMEHCCSHAG